MRDDDILGEIRKFRDEYAARFNYDLAAIFQDLREREHKSGREYVTLSPKRIVPMVEVPLQDERGSGPSPQLVSSAPRES